MSDDDFLDELQDAAIAASSIVGVNQRSQQINELQQVKGLLQAQANERQRQANLPKCPECKHPLELEASLCGQCHSRIEWIEFNSGPTPLPQSRLKEELSTIQGRYQSRCSDVQSQWNESICTLLEATKSGNEELQNLSTQFTEQQLTVSETASANQADFYITAITFIVVAWLFITVAVFGIYKNANDVPLLVTGLILLALSTAIGLVFVSRSDSTKHEETIQHLLITKVYPNLCSASAEIATLTEIQQFCADYRIVMKKAATIGIFDEIPPPIVAVSDLNLPVTHIEDESQYHDPNFWSQELGILDSWFKQNAESKAIRSAIPVAATKPPVGTPKVSGITPAKQDFPIEEAPAAMPSAPTQLNNYFWIKRGGKTKGPISLATMLKHLSQKQIKVSDKIRESEDGPWETAAVAAKRIKAMANKG